MDVKPRVFFIKLLLILFSVCLPLSLLNNSVLALSDADIDSIYTDSVWYDNSEINILCTSDPNSGSAGTPSGPVNDGNPYHTMLYPPVNDDTKVIAAINKYIEDNASGSPYAGMGDAFVAGGKRSNVSPFLAIAILQKESSLGTANGGWGDPNKTNGIPSYNGFGRSATDSQPHVLYNGTDNYGNPTTWKVYKWASWRNSLDDGPNGDDWFNYFRSVYFGDLNIAPGDFSTLVTKYLGPSTTEQHAQYLSQILGYIDGVVKLLDIPGIEQYASSSGSSVNSCPTPEMPANGEFIWPITKADYQSLTTCWNTPRTLNGSTYRHGGLDISAARGKNIYASASGTVEVAGDQGGNGLSVVINHGNGYWTVYKHQQVVLVTVGEKVTQNQVIGKVDSTGASTGDHLHFNIQNVGGIVNAGEGALNPLDFLPNDGRSYQTGNPSVGSCIPGPSGQTGTGGQDINT